MVRDDWGSTAWAPAGRTDMDNGGVLLRAWTWWWEPAKACPSLVLMEVSGADAGEHQRKDGLWLQHDDGKLLGSVLEIL